MATTIRDAFRTAWSLGPASEPDNPDKTEIWNAGGTIDAEIDAIRSVAQGAAAGNVQAATWTALAAIAGTRAGQPGRVPTSDAGTHTDPVVGGTVPNSGEFSWSTSPAGWRRIGAVIDASAVQNQIAAETQLRSSLIAPGIGNAALKIRDNLGFVLSYLTTLGIWRGNGFATSNFEIGAARNGEILSIRDPRGFKFLSLTTAGLRAPGLYNDAEYNLGWNPSPLFGGHLTAFDGEETNISARSMFRQRSDRSRVRMSFYSEAPSDHTSPAYARTGDDEIVVDLQKSQSTAYLQTRLDDFPDTRSLATVTVVNPPLAPSSGNSTTLLMLGDSIVNRQMAARMGLIATSKGYTLTFRGTLPGAGTGPGSTIESGPLGEGREGWSWLDFTYETTDRGAPVAVGGEAAYLAMSKAEKQNYNPFIRAATGSDDAAKVKNGYIFDYAFYLTRFSIATPASVFIDLLTNDVLELATDANVVTAVTSGLNIVVGSILASRPTTKVFLWVPPISRSSRTDALWSKYVAGIEVIMAYARSTAGCYFLPTHALGSQEIGFALDTGSTNAIGVKTAALSDEIHFSAYNISKVAQNLAAAAAAVAQSSI